MSDTLALDLKTSIHWSFREALSLSTVTDSSKLEYNRSLADGTDDDEVDKLWHDLRGLPPETFEDIDLTALVQTLYGNAIAIDLAKVKVLMIVNQSTTAGDDLLVGGAGAGNNAWTAPFDGDADAKIVVPPDSTLLLVNKTTGWAVAGGSSDVLRIENETLNLVPYKILIAGTSS
jgi:hypothetical protein